MLATWVWLSTVSVDAVTLLWPTHSAAAAEIESPMAAAVKRMVFIVGSFASGSFGRVSQQCGSPKSQFFVHRDKRAETGGAENILCGGLKLAQRHFLNPVVGALAQD